MKKFLRLISLLLCLILSVAAVSCAKTGENSETTAGSTLPESESLTSETTLEYACLPVIDFGGQLINILYWQDVERPEFFVQELTGDIVGDAIYERNMNIENRLNIKLNFIGTPGNVGNSDEYLKVVSNSFNAGEKNYDILASHSRTGAVVAAGGMAMDILGVENSYLDFDQPWWPETLIDTATIGNKMYFVSGDISTNTLHFMYGIYYNADLITNNALEDPTALALAGNWTLDKLISMSSNFYTDLNGNNKKDYGDFFGLTTLFFHADSFYFGSGMKCIEKSNETTLCISPDFYSEKAINLADKLGDWFALNCCYTENNNANTYKTFSAGNALFAQNRIYIADSSHDSGLNKATFKYGLVPVPKYDENQDRYYTTVGNPFTLYEIMTNCDKATEVSAVLECWAGEAYRKTTPAIFEINMKCKYAQNEETSQIFDIIRGAIVFDLGRIFGAKLSTMSEIYSNACIANNSWATIVAAQKKVLGKQLDALVKSFNQ